MCTICLVNKKESTLCRLFCLQNKNLKCETFQFSQINFTETVLKNEIIKYGNVVQVEFDGHRASGYTIPNYEQGYSLCSLPSHIKLNRNITVAGFLYKTNDASKKYIDFVIENGNIFVAPNIETTNYNGMKLYFVFICDNP